MLSKIVGDFRRLYRQRTPRARSVLQLAAAGGEVVYSGDHGPCPLPIAVVARKAGPGKGFRGPSFPRTACPNHCRTANLRTRQSKKPSRHSKSKQAVSDPCSGTPVDRLLKHSIQGQPRWTQEHGHSSDQNSRFSGGCKFSQNFLPLCSGTQTIGPVSPASQPGQRIYLRYKPRLTSPAARIPSCSVHGHAEQ